jgi:N-acetylneuraminic acid mutarotase
LVIYPFTVEKESVMNTSKSIAAHSIGLILLLFASLNTATFGLVEVACAQGSPSWGPTGSLNTPRSGPTATLLSTGKVLVVGGRNGNYLNTAELYDPETGTWSITGSLNTTHGIDTATLLPNGKVLVVGGIANGNSAELYDPATGTWSNTGGLNVARFWHTATLLTNGKVLVVGGAGGDTGNLNSAELYDPATGIWTTTGSLNTARYGHTATLLLNGKLLIVGGSDDGDLASTLASTELYDPNTGTWSVSSNLNASRIFHTATLLPNGEVLVAAGYTDNWIMVGGISAASPTSLKDAERYNPTTRKWSIAASLSTARNSHTATLLPNGKVLVAGGGFWTPSGPCGLTAGCFFNILNTTEVYDLATGTWSAGAPLNTGRSEHTATLLANGKVLAVGGNNIAASLNSAELYGVHTGIGPQPTGQFVNGQAQYADLNGDNNADLIFQGGDNTFWISLSTGTGFTPAIPGI